MPIISLRSTRRAFTILKAAFAILLPGIKCNHVAQGNFHFSADQPVAANLNTLLLEDLMEKTSSSETSNSTNLRTPYLSHKTVCTS